MGWVKNTLIGLGAIGAIGTLAEPCTRKAEKLQVPYSFNASDKAAGDTLSKDVDVAREAVRENWLRRAIDKTAFWTTTTSEQERKEWKCTPEEIATIERSKALAISTAKTEWAKGLLPQETQAGSGYVPLCPSARAQIYDTNSDKPVLGLDFKGQDVYTSDYFAAQTNNCEQAAVTWRLTHPVASDAFTQVVHTGPDGGVQAKNRDYHVELMKSICEAAGSVGDMGSALTTALDQGLPLEGGMVAKRYDLKDPATANPKALVTVDYPLNENAYIADWKMSIAPTRHGWETGAGEAGHCTVKSKDGSQAIKQAECEANGTLSSTPPQ